MLKRICTILMASVLCLNCVPVIAQEADTSENIIRIYVSTEGNDENTGDKQSPLLTLEAARKKVRTMKGSAPVEVIFSGGEYRFTQGVDFVKEDSGTEEAPVTYKAADGEKVVFKGSFKFDADTAKSVNDEEILSRVDIPVRNKLVQYDLNQLGYIYGLPATNKIQQFQFLTYPKEEEYVNLFLDDKEQMISQWPNGDDEYVSWTVAIARGGAINSGKAGGIFEYAGDRPDRWGKAKDLWVGGYPGYNYRYERNSVARIDTAKKQIELATPTCFGLISQESKSWKAFNLLEEIDLPGEWFIDRSTMTLYYYPPYSLKDKSLEISFLAAPFFNMANVSHVNIEGIEFAQHRATAIDATSCSYINIDGCTFRNIEGRGVRTKGTNRTTYNWSRWKDGAYEFHVKNCTFDNIGASAIELEGGDIDTLESGNCSITNNLFMRISTKVKNAEALLLNGCGNVVKNNDLSSASFHAITYRGSNHIINNNEFYDVNKCTDDSGAVYAGRDYNLRGTEIAYNYFHDNYAYRQVSRGFQIAVYWDDGLCGQNAHHNIIANGQAVLMSSGQDNHFDNNTIVNSSHYGILMRRNTGRVTADVSDVNLLADKELYFSRFPAIEMGMKTEFADKSWNCTSVGNLEVNVPEPQYTRFEYGKIDNVRVETCDDFVDVANQDYRIKSGSQTASKLPDLIDESFDLDTIGVMDRDYTFDENTASFEKLYPYDNQDAIPSLGIEFAWERVFGANNYRLVIARDKAMTDIVYDKVVPYHINKVEGLEENTEYYWQVWANNISRKYNSSWSCNSEPYLFKTALYNSTDITGLKIAVKESEERLAVSTEGENPGEYIKGSLNEIRNHVFKGNLLLNFAFGKNTQSEIDSLHKKMNEFWENEEIINPGHINLLSKASTQTDWAPIEYATVKDGESLFVTGKSSAIAYADKFKNITKKCVICFKAKITTGNWVGLGMNQNEMMPYAQGNPGYFFAVKKDMIELQKNAGSGSSILQTKDIQVANDGKYHDWEFGAIKLNTGRLLTLKIDGNTIFEYIDIIPVTEKLMPLFHVTKGDTIEILNASVIPDESAYNSLVSDTVDAEADLVYKQFGEAEGLVIFKSGLKSAIKDGKLNKLSETEFAFVDGTNYISKEAAQKLFSGWSVDGVDAVTVSGNTMYPLSDLAKANDYGVNYDNVTNLIFISKGLKDELRNMVKLLNATTEFFDNVSKVN